MTHFQILSAFNCKYFIKKYHQHYKLFKILLNKDCPVFICDFHRQQAWESWFHKKVNSHSEDKSKIVPLLRDIAHSETLEKSEETTGLPETSEYWINGENLRDCISKYWLKVKEVSKSIIWFNISIRWWSNASWISATLKCFPQFKNQDNGTYRLHSYYCIYCSII